MAHPINLKIKELVDEKSTQTAVAKILGISQPSLHRRFKSQKLSFSKKEMELIADYIKVDIDDFKKLPDRSTDSFVSEPLTIEYGYESKYIRSLLEKTKSMELDIRDLNQEIRELKRKNNSLEDEKKELYDLLKTSRHSSPQTG